MKRQTDAIAPRSVEFFEPNMIQADTPSGASTGEYDEQPQITQGVVMNMDQIGTNHTSIQLNNDSNTKTLESRGQSP